MGNKWKGKISRTILNIFRFYNRIDVLKLPFLEEPYEKTFVPYVKWTLLEILIIDIGQKERHAKLWKLIQQMSQIRQ